MIYLVFGTILIIYLVFGTILIVYLVFVKILNQLWSFLSIGQINIAVVGKF